MSITITAKRPTTQDLPTLECGHPHTPDTETLACAGDSFYVRCADKCHPDHIADCWHCQQETAAAATFEFWRDDYDYDD